MGTFISLDDFREQISWMPINTGTSTSILHPCNWHKQLAVVKGKEGLLFYVVEGETPIPSDPFQNSEIKSAALKLDISSNDFIIVSSFSKNSGSAA